MAAYLEHPPAGYVGWLECRFFAHQPNERSVWFWDGEVLRCTIGKPAISDPAAYTDFVPLGDVSELRAEVERLRGLLAESLSAIDEAYQATGYFKVAKTSEQRMRIESALAPPTPQPTEKPCLELN